MSISVEFSDFPNWVGEMECHGSARNIKSAPFLGAGPLSRVTQGIVVMRPKPARIVSLVIALERAISSGRVHTAFLLEICGKTEFICYSSGISRLGRAALATIHAWVVNTRYRRSQRESDGSFAIDGELRAALAFLACMLPLLKPRTFNLYRRQRRPIVVYSDAMYSAGSDVPPVSGWSSMTLSA